MSSGDPKNGPVPNIPGSLLDLQGTGKGLWEEDAQEYINKLRDEWDD